MPAPQTYVAKVIKTIDANKAKFAFLAPFVLTVGGTIASYVVTGDFNEAEIRTAVSGLILSAAGAAGAYFKASDEVEVVKPVVPVPAGVSAEDVADVALPNA